MNIALDSEGKRVSALRADKIHDYFCPVCKSQLIIKQGAVNAWHFAHKHANECPYHENETEWHIEWKNRFPQECQQIIFRDPTTDKVIHRADVVVGNIVIEFQNSPIDHFNFESRNQFYASIGKTIIWVFNYRQKYNNGGIYIHTSNCFRTSTAIHASNDGISEEGLVQTEMRVDSPKWKMLDKGFDVQRVMICCDFDESKKRMFSALATKWAGEWYGAQHSYSYFVSMIKNGTTPQSRLNDAILHQRFLDDVQIRKREQQRKRLQDIKRRQREEYLRQQKISEMKRMEEQKKKEAEELKEKQEREQKEKRAFDQWNKQVEERTKSIEFHDEMLDFIQKKKQDTERKNQWLAIKNWLTYLLKKGFQIVIDDPDMPWRDET